MTTPTEGSAPGSGPGTLPCPSCGASFVLGAERCAACELPLTGPLASRLWQIDQEIARLTERRATVLDGLRGVAEQAVFVASSSAPAQPTAASPGWATVQAPAPAAGLASAPPPSGPAMAGPPTGGYAARPPSSSATGQQILLGMGVLLLFIASIVFVAVAWDILGVYGRLAALVVAIAVCASVTAFCSPRRLTSSAEAFAVLAVGLSVVGLSAAYALDLFGAGDLTVRFYVAIAAAVMFALGTLLHPTARPVMTYPLVALVSAWVAVVALLADGSLLGWSAALIAGWIVLASPLVRWSRQLLDPADQLLGPAAGVWAERGASAGSWWAPLWPIGLLSGFAGVVGVTVVIGQADASAGSLALAAGLALASIAVVGAALRAYLPFAALPRQLVVASVSVWVVLGVELGALVRNAGVVASVVTVAVCVVLLLVLLCVRSARTQSWSPHLGTTAVGAGVTAAALVVLDGEAGASAFVLALIAAGAAALAIAEPPWRLGAELVSVSTAFASLCFALVAIDATADTATFVFSVAGVALAALAAVRRPHSTDEEVVFVIGAAVALGTAISVAYAQTVDLDDGRAAGSATALAIAFGIAAVTALLYATQPGRGVAIVLALPLAIAAVWTPMFDAGVDILEAYTLSAAVLCALVGIVTAVRLPTIGSWVTWGPTLGFLLIPSSALAIAGSDGRLAYVLVVGTALLILGVALRAQAVVAIPGAALVLVAVQQLLLLARGLPPTLTFTIAGVVLVAAGVRYERNVRDLRTVGTWFDRMT